MKICQKHWDKLREALKQRGLDHLGPKSEQRAIAAVATELEGRGAENEYDPLMDCNNMVWSNGLRVLGLAVMNPQPDGSELCPICEAIRVYEDDWIQGPTNAALAHAREKGLVEGETP